ncbi:MAG: hypothetical protein U0X73_15435 [Thermoanaerobaculia bacterium]
MRSRSIRRSPRIRFRSLGASSGAAIVLAAWGALALAAAAAAADRCGPNRIREATDNHVDSVQLVPALGFVDGTLDPELIDLAAGAWRACPGIPSFSRAARSLKPPIVVEFVVGRAPDGIGDDACGFFSGRTIRLYAFRRDGTPCPRDALRVVQEIQHELGHWLGLGDQCPGSRDIMGPVDGNRHLVHGDCVLADELNRTLAEESVGRESERTASLGSPGRGSREFRSPESPLELGPAGVRLTSPATPWVVGGNYRCSSIVEAHCDDTGSQGGPDGALRRPTGRGPWLRATSQPPD